MDGKLLIVHNQLIMNHLHFVIRQHGLSMNVLVLDPKTVCVEKSEVYQAEQLDKLGMEVIPVEMRDAYAFGGGLHCCTADVYREGELKDYFPKQ